MDINEIVNEVLRGPIENISRSSYDDFVEENVGFMARSGMKSYIVRRQLGNCCEWCAGLAGTYEYGKEPKAVYQRHDNCSCIVTYINEKGEATDTWSKKTYANQRAARIAKEEKSLDTSAVDFMGESRRFVNNTFSIKAYKIRGQENIYSQTYSQNAQIAIETILKSRHEIPQLQSVKEIIIAKSIPGIAAYDHVENRLYINEQLADDDFISFYLSSDYFAAENFLEVLRHEMYHKSHWDAVDIRGLTGLRKDIVKQNMERPLREYVSAQLAQDPRYIKKNVSENAAEGVAKTGLNELIAEVLLQRYKGLTKDIYLEQLVVGIVYDAVDS